MVTLADVRFFVADPPRAYPPSNSDPEALGFTDGVRTTFLATYPNIIAGTFTLYRGAYVQSGTESLLQFQTIPPAEYVQIGQVVTMLSPPLSGGALYANYQTTAFSDYDLTQVMNRNVLTYGAYGDGLVLKACLYDLLLVIVADVDRLKLLRQGDYQQDARHIAQLIDTIRKEIRNDLECGPRAGKQIPTLVQQPGRIRQFQTRN